MNKRPLDLVRLGFACAFAVVAAVPAHGKPRDYDEPLPDSLLANVGGSGSCSELCMYQVGATWLSIERSMAADFYDLRVRSDDGDEDDEATVYHYRGARLTYVHNINDNGTVYIRGGLGVQVLTLEEGELDGDGKVGPTGIIAAAGRTSGRGFFVGIELQHHVQFVRENTSATMLFLGLEL